VLEALSAYGALYLHDIVATLMCIVVGFGVKEQCKKNCEHPQMHLTPCWGRRHGSKPVALLDNGCITGFIYLLPQRDPAAGPPAAIKTPRISSAYDPQVQLSIREE
jgi:hypothetical protein